MPEKGQDYLNYVVLKNTDSKKQGFILPQIGIGQGRQQNIKYKNIILYYLSETPGASAQIHQSYVI